MLSSLNRADSVVTAVIVEDEAALRDEMQELLQTLWPALDIVGTADNGSDALKIIHQYQPDIVFLDIQIPQHSGLEVAQALPSHCDIVFVTAYDAHAIEAFEQGAIDYVLKPISLQRLAVTVERLQQRLAAMPTERSGLKGSALPMAATPRQLRWLTATVGKSMRLIMIDEVLYFQADQKYTRVVLTNSEVLITKTLKELLAELDPEQFWQIHRSTIVNALEIASIEPALTGQLTIRLKRRDEQLPVSESFMKKFRQL